MTNNKPTNELRWCPDVEPTLFRENSNSSTETIRENAETSTKCQCSSCLAALILSGEKSLNDQ